MMSGSGLVVNREADERIKLQIKWLAATHHIDVEDF